MSGLRVRTPGWTEAAEKRPCLWQASGVKPPEKPGSRSGEALKCALDRRDSRFIAAVPLFSYLEFSKRTENVGKNPNAPRA